MPNTRVFRVMPAAGGGSTTLKTTRRLAAVVRPRAPIVRVSVWEAPVSSFPPRVPPITSPAPLVLPPGHPAIDLPTHPCSLVVAPGDVIVRIVLTAPRPVPEKFSGDNNIRLAETVFSPPAIKITPTAAAKCCAYFIVPPFLLFNWLPCQNLANYKSNSRTE